MTLFLRSGFRKDLAGTIAATIAVTLSTIVVTRVLARELGADEFGKYTVARRTLGVLSPVLTLMIADGLLRYVATAKTDRERFSWLAGALLSGGALSVGAALIGIAFPQMVSKAIFGSAAEVSVVVAIGVFLLGYSAHSIVYAQLRGEGGYQHANVLNAVITGLAPAALVALIASHSAAEALGLLTLPFSVSFIALVVLAKPSAARRRASWQEVSSARRDLIRYGLPRVPGALAFNGILALGPWILARGGDLGGAGALGIGQLLLRVAEPGAVALGLVALPRVARMASSGDLASLRMRIESGLSLLLPLALFLSLQGPLWAPLFIRALLGTGFEQASRLASVVALSIGPYLCYISLRAVLDGLSPKAHNARNLVVTLCVAILASWALWKRSQSPESVAVALSISVLVLGLSTLQTLHTLIRPNWRKLRLGSAVVTVLVGALVSYGADAELAPGYLKLSTMAISGIATILWLGRDQLRGFHRGRHGQGSDQSGTRSD